METDLVFPTIRGGRDNRQNIRQRLIHPAVERANEKLRKFGLESIGQISPHSLRRTYASLRAAVGDDVAWGDDVAYTSAQIGHADPKFTLRVYTHAVKRRQRLQGAELEQFNRAVEWADWARTGTNGAEAAAHHPNEARSEQEKPRSSGASSRWAVLGSNQ